MKPSIDKLRWALAGGSLFLLLVLVAVVGYGRIRAAMMWKHRLDKLGIQVEQTTDNVTFSKTIAGRTVFTLRAGKAIQHKDGKTILHNVQLTLYGNHDGSEDRIYGSEFEYDEKAGIARALGEVEMDIRAPGSLSKNQKQDEATTSPAAPAPASGRDIHVRTSGLTYIRKLGVAATDQPVMFSYAGLQCSAKGAEFQSGEEVVHLLADVQLQGTLRGKQLTLHATKADLDHDNDTVVLVNPDLQSRDEKATAASAVLHLRHDGSIETAQAEGNVVLQKQTRHITGARMDGKFSTDNNPIEASLTGGVNFSDSNAEKPMHGSASRVDGSFDSSGSPTKWTASGGVQMVTAVRGDSGQMLSRSIRGEQVNGLLRPGARKSQREVSELHVTGAAQAVGEAASGTGKKTTQIAADDLRATFGMSTKPGSPAIEKVLGVGHTRLEQSGSDGARDVSSADRLQMSFSPNAAKRGELQIATAMQDGNVRFESHPAAKANDAKAAQPVSARAERSSYNGTTQDLMLTGSAEFQQGATSIAANSLLIHQVSGDSDAEGNVLATLTHTSGKSNAEATHIRADRAHLVRATQTGVFRSTDAHPARLWQGPSQVEAASISWDGKKTTLAARPDSPGALVHAVFASTQSGSSASGATQREPQVERVTSSTLDYDDAAHTATFVGNFQMQNETGVLQAQRAQIFFAADHKGSPLAPASTGASGVPLMGGSLQKAVVWGDVRLSQPGRVGRGDRLVYTTADASFVLTGTPAHPPQIVDAAKGSLTGAMLTFHSGDNTVVVSGSTASVAPGEHQRVHTETGAKP